jgi:hypothetical protein
MGISTAARSCRKPGRHISSRAEEVAEESEKQISNRRKSVRDDRINGLKTAHPRVPLKAPFKTPGEADFFTSL